MPARVKNNRRSGARLRAVVPGQILQPPFYDRKPHLLYYGQETAASSIRVTGGSWLGAMNAA